MNHSAAPLQTLTDKLIARKEGAIGWVIFNNPERHNATSFEMWQSLPLVLDAYVRDPEVRVIIFRGTGEKAFSAGADISQFKEKRSSAEAVKAYNDTADASSRGLRECAKPTIAMASNAPLTIAAVKRSLIELQKVPGERDLELCQRMVDACFQSEDYQEGQTAFMEKRKPQFKGR